MTYLFEKLRKSSPEPLKKLLRPMYYMSQKIIKFFIRAFFKLCSLITGRKNFLLLKQYISEEIDTTLEVGGITFQCRDYTPLHRAVTLLTKEPDLIYWMDNFFSEGDIFYDVGANIGVYSLYAAVNKKCTVYSFEPLASTYSVLNENIQLNGLSEKIKAINLALHNKMMLSDLNVSLSDPGKAGNSFVIPMGSRGFLYKPTFLQGLIGMRMDEFVEMFDVPFPNFVKIDVDANEPEIIEGMEKILSDPRLKGIAIEINTAWPRQMELSDKICGFGFKKLSGERYVNQLYESMGPVINYFFSRI